MLSPFIIDQEDEFIRGHLYKYEIEVETEDVASTGLVFEFEVDYANDAGEDVTWEIKGCGILQLLDVPLLSFRDGDGDF
ncbi:BnaCnng40060D [Brassica napus]|uniref:BnaCnng40060D protein n=1 Tax=Brassica napus TaxID=3708 RepID=A0A078JCJ1_BRANA|nr:BnaCnng40060D [Brassica napus]